MTDDEFYEGYRDGYDLTCPEPSSNRSHSYRHSFAIGRAEKQKDYSVLLTAENARLAAKIAEQKDARQ